MRGMGCAVVFALSVLAGCGNSGELPTYAVKGKVEIEGGGPLKAGQVMFVSDKVTAKGLVKEDGTFTLGTYGDADGAPAGSYKVYIIGTSVPKAGGSGTYDREELIDKKYSDQTTSELTFTVEQKSNECSLTVKKPGA